ncbi:enoyl-CoA hydratase-related protein [Paracrocinitomix mangrovi]|uniref:enoyl-CoA hydratase-related protein n=1 Tax=Paracrocinitomix mangrovi TaxID=2862509 RepID=UPI001C8E15B5|nr:enoyl-CoA hydratase-related protein [Paracrocinitomix mangrovi]UKN02798.1 enoyl-CoA hydratase-related protein [Paracrocinitomix mangrovi]
MSTILFEIKDNVAYITLNRPAVYNSFNKEMSLEMQNRLDECEENDEVRAIYIKGEGKAFCAGQDLGEVTDPNGPELTSIVRDHYNPIIERIRNIEKPIIGAVNGVAAGAGANIALACDICVATASASFIQAFSMIGLIPDSGGTFTLPRLVGFQKASALMMLGDKVGAEDAERMNMIYKFYSDETFDEESKKLAMKLAQMPTKGLGLTKRALNLSMISDLTTQLKTEEELQTIAGSTYDYNEGVAAFLEKRKPSFKGE